MLNKEDWEYITANWSSSDPSVMEKIASLRNKDILTHNELESSLMETRKELENLRLHNQELNNTNISLVLRMTDPNNPLNTDNGSSDEYVAPRIDDYDAFIK